ncbi:VanZ-like domain-containing protein [Flavobacterium branchiophilum]
MFKPNNLSIIIYILSKYLFFYIFMMFKNDNYALISLGNLENFQDIFYFLFIFLLLPITNIIFLSLPIYYSFKVKNLYYFLIIIFLILAVEYTLYTYMASQSNLLNGIYNGILSLFFLFLFFSRSIFEISKKNNLSDI